MRIVLCHDCWSWVPHAGATCPVCHHPIELSRPDPPVARLALLLGEALVRLGGIELDRRELPRVGSLLGTTTGLLFLPQFETLPDGALLAAERRGPTTRGWTMWPFRRREAPTFGRQFAAAMVRDSAEGPAVTTGSEESPLADSFLDAPGAWFVPREQVVRIHVRGRIWSLSRGRGPTLRFTMASPPEEWRPAWRQLLADTPAWAAIAPRL
jgi:hypothetical protein